MNFPTSTDAALHPLQPAHAAIDAEAGVTVAELYRQMWGYAAGARGWLVFSSALLVASQLIKLLVPWLAAQAIQTLQKVGTTGLASCFPWVAAIVGVSVGCWLMHGPGRVIERSVAVRVRRALADKLYLQLSRAPLPWHEAQHSAELAHRVTQASQALSNFTQSQFLYLQNAVNLVGPLVALWLLSHWAGGLALTGLAAVALTIVAFDRALMRLARQENDAERRHASALLDCLTSVATVMSLRLQQATRRLLARRLDAAVAPLARSIALNEWKWCAVDLLTVTLSWSLVAVYAWNAQGSGALMLGGVFMVYQYAQQAGGVIGSLAANLQNFARIRIDFASAAPVWSAPQRAQAEPAPGTPPWHCIDLCDLHFQHATAEGLAAGSEHADLEERRGGLRGISLRLHAGERIALVGPSGSGKSTLLRLLAGLYVPTQGHVEIDGIAALGARDLATCATLIPQEAQIFEATVRENIGFDLPCSEAEIEEACRIGSFDAVLRGLPLGLATPITQGGFNLSGGQRQRLCLARGILAAQGSSVLLLDEPTSALDPLTESLVHARLKSAFPTACVIASVHRMSLLDRFDRVVLLVQGEIVDVGTVDQLLVRQPLFREMVGSEGQQPYAAEPRASDLLLERQYAR